MIRHEAYKKQVAQNLTDSEALSEVFEKIDEAGIWIPEHEVISAYRAKKTKYRKRFYSKIIDGKEVTTYEMLILLRK